MSAKKKPAEHRIISHWTPPRTPDFNVEPDIEYGVKLKRAFILQAVAPPSCPAINIEIRGCGGGGPSTSAHGGLFFRRHRNEVGCLLCSVMSCLCCVLCCLLCCALSTLCVLSALLCSVLCALCSLLYPRLTLSCLLIVRLGNIGGPEDKTNCERQKTTWKRSWDRGGEEHVQEFCCTQSGCLSVQRPLKERI